MVAAVSCSLSVPWFGGVKMGLGLTSKLGHAWVRARIGATVVHGWSMVVVMWDDVTRLVLSAETRLPQ